MRLVVLVSAALSLAMLVPTASCTSAPSEPTWTEDVAPILAANCARCHGRVPRSGAPSTFRLDVFSGRGAQLMAPFIAERTHSETMPPSTPLAGVQIDTLRNWAANGAPQGDPAPGNEPPQISIESFLGTGLLTLPYVITDADFDIVTGDLLARRLNTEDETLITRDLHSGAGSATWFAAAEPEGDYEIIARLRDGHLGREFNLGRFRVTHENGNTEPTVTINQPQPESILLDTAAPLSVEFSISDPDPGDTATATISMIRGDEAVELANVPNIGAGDHTVLVDTTQVPEGPNWSLVVAISGARAVASRIVISRSQTALRYADVQPILATYCDACHSQNDVVSIPFLYNFSAQYASIEAFSGASYRRVILERSMPPRSIVTLFGVEEISEADRQKLGEWLAAGAPE